MSLLDFLTDQPCTDLSSLIRQLEIHRKRHDNMPLAAIAHGADGNTHLVASVELNRGIATTFPDTSHAIRRKAGKTEWCLMITGRA